MRGKIITFYSFKGGTGRSLLLANIALLLASNDRKVAVIDWDLEAPGLHRYFRPFISDPELKSTDGLIDLFSGYWDQLISVSENPSCYPESWADEFLDIFKYSINLRLPSNTEGQITLIPAGRQTQSYASKVGNFDWDRFYSEAGGKGLLDELSNRLRDKFDYILIDSRTGVSDTAGICTIHLPDELVICFTYNNQNVLGALSVAHSANKSRNTSTQKTQNKRPIKITPVPTRVSDYNKELLQARQEFVWDNFDWCISKATYGSSSEYWLAVEQPFDPDQSYVELLAPIINRPGDPRSLLSAIERVASKITDNQVQKWIPIFDSNQLKSLKESYYNNINEIISIINENDVTSNIISNYTPLLLRLINGDTLKYEAVSSTLYANNSELLIDAINHGIFVLKYKNPTESFIELSSYAKRNIIHLDETAQQYKKTINILDEISRGSSKNIKYSHFSSKWFSRNYIELSYITEKNILIPKEEEFIERMKLLNAERSAKIKYLSIASFLCVGTILSSFYYINEKNIYNKTILRDKELSIADLRKQTDDISKNKFSILVGKGHESIGKKEYKNAAEFFTEAIKINKDGSSDVYRARAVAYTELKRRASNEKDKQDYNTKMLGDYLEWANMYKSAGRYFQVSHAFYENKATASDEKEAIDLFKKGIELYGNPLSTEKISPTVRDMALKILENIKKSNSIERQDYQNYKSILSKENSLKDREIIQ